MKKEIKKTGLFFIQNLEAFIWISVIFYFAVSPIHLGSHFTICPLSLSGFDYCPGCGLGRALILLLHGRVADSFTMHPLAPFALLVLITRIIAVFRKTNNFRKQTSTLDIRGLKPEKAERN